MVIPAGSAALPIAELVDENGSELTLECEHVPFLRPGVVVTLFVQEGGLGKARRASLKSIVGRTVVFRAFTEWISVDRRTHPRHEIRLRTGVRSAGSNDEALGVTLDISAGGMAVEVLDCPASAVFEVAVGLRQDPVFVPCDVVERRDMDDVSVLRLRFAPETEEQAEHIATLIQDLLEYDAA